ncbi:MAG TPA: hypothetical protein VFP84_34590 [Kofleriaceae bacterium]|nr:hypothetical protein [Kofleriaceae bacterium]
MRGDQIVQRRDHALLHQVSQLARERREQRDLARRAKPRHAGRAVQPQPPGVERHERGLDHRDQPGARGRARARAAGLEPRDLPAQRRGRDFGAKARDQRKLDLEVELEERREAVILTLRRLARRPGEADQRRDLRGVRPQRLGR